MNKMQTPDTGLMLSVSLVALLLAQDASAESWLAFGDSLSDTGNAFALTGGAIPDPAYYEGGRFSNGPIWFDRIAVNHGLLADYLLGQAAPDRQDWNFAVGGATSGTDPLDPATGTPPGLRTQVDMARGLIAGGDVQVGPDTTAVLWAGANDHGMWLTDPLRDAALDETVADAVVGNVAAATRGIVEAGVGRAAVLNLFDFSFAPTTALLPGTLRDAGDAMVARHNAGLLRHVETIDADSEAQVLLVDVHGLFHEIARDTAAWGFDNLSPCLPDGGAPTCTMPGSADRRVFWDGTHLTSAAHELVAGMVQGTLAAGQDLPQLSGETTALSFGLTDGHLRDARTQIVDGAPGGWIEATNFGLTAGRQSGRFSGVAAGWSERSGDTSYGASLTWSDGETAAGRTTINASGWTASAFLRQEYGALGLTGQFGLGRTTMDLSRDTSFGPTPRAAAQAEATSRIVDIGADYGISSGDFRLMVDGGLTWADTQRDGYGESGGGLMNGRVGGHALETLSVRLGATGSMDLDLAPVPLAAFARVSWRDVLDDRSSGGGVDLGSGQHVRGQDVSGIVEGAEVEIGMATRIADRVTGRASWTVSPFEDDMTDGRLGLSLGMQF